MKRNHNILLISFLIFTSLLILFGCNKVPPSFIGLNVVGDNPFNGAMTDTTTIVSYTMNFDSVLTSNLQESRGILLGAIYDATFGKTTASLAVSFVSTKGSLKDSVNTLEVDSVVLSMAYSDIYGDENTQQTFRVYELNEKIDTSSYYSNYIPEYIQPEMGNTTYTIEADTSAQENKIIKIHLDNSFGQRILNLPNTVLNSHTEFVEEFNGLYICPDPVNTPNAGAFINAALINSNTHIRIYYHSAVVDSAAYDLFVNTSSKYFSNFEHYDYQDACQGFKQQVLQGDTILGEETLLIHAMGGTMAKLSFPYIREFAKLDNIAIQDAKLVFTVSEEDTYFGVPSHFELVKKSEEGKMVLIKDYISGIEYYNGNLTPGNTSFFFRINEQLYDMILGNDNNELYLHIRNSNTTPGRAVLYGAKPNDIDKRIKLQITYTTID